MSPVYTTIYIEANLDFFDQLWPSYATIQEFLDANPERSWWSFYAYMDWKRAIISECTNCDNCLEHSILGTTCPKHTKESLEKLFFFEPQRCFYNNWQCGSQTSLLRVLNVCAANEQPHMESLQIHRDAEYKLRYADTNTLLIIGPDKTVTLDCEAVQAAYAKLDKLRLSANEAIMPMSATKAELAADLKKTSLYAQRARYMFALAEHYKSIAITTLNESALKVLSCEYSSHRAREAYTDTTKRHAVLLQPLENLYNEALAKKEAFIKCAKECDIALKRYNSISKESEKYEHAVLGAAKRKYLRLYNETQVLSSACAIVNDQFEQAQIAANDAAELTSLDALSIQRRQEWLELKNDKNQAINSFAIAKNAASVAIASFENSLNYKINWERLESATWAEYLNYVKQTTLAQKQLDACIVKAEQELREVLDLFQCNAKVRTCVYAHAHVDLLPSQTLAQRDAKIVKAEQEISAVMDSFQFKGEVRIRLYEHVDFWTRQTPLALMNTRIVDAEQELRAADALVQFNKDVRTSVYELLDFWARQTTLAQTQTNAWPVQSVETQIVKTSSWLRKLMVIPTPDCWAVNAEQAADEMSAWSERFQFNEDVRARVESLDDLL